MAADPDARLGHCCYPLRSSAKPSWVLCRTILLGRGRERAVPRRGLLSLYVV